MRPARIAVVGGLLLLAVGFGVGVEPAPARVRGAWHGCGSVIPTSWIMSGAPDTPSDPTRPATTAERHAHRACDRAEARTRVLTWTLLGLGAVSALVGWTVLREEVITRRPAHEPTTGPAT